MLGNTDIRLIDTGYFDIIDVKDFSLAIRSRITGHEWYLLEQECNGHRTFQIRHRHHGTDPYHPQKNRPTIESCCEYIMEHDAFHLERIQKKEQRRLRRFRSA